MVYVNRVLDLYNNIYITTNEQVLYLDSWTIYVLACSILRQQGLILRGGLDATTYRIEKAIIIQFSDFAFHARTFEMLYEYCYEIVRIEEAKRNIQTD